MVNFSLQLCFRLRYESRCKAVQIIRYLPERRIQKIERIAAVSNIYLLYSINQFYAYLRRVV